MILACVSDVGKIKKNNEDYVLINQEERIFILADGVGGTNGGEIASKEASKFIHEKISEYINKYGFQKLTKDVLQNIFYDANSHLYKIKNDDISLMMMGTTVVLCVCSEKNDAIIAHIGDSRAYLIDDNTIQQITKDHSMVQKLVDENSITKEEARISIKKNVITKALGPINTMANNEKNLDIITPDVVELKLEKEDKLLLCSDGLSDMLTDSEIFDIVKSADNIDMACSILLKSAYGCGGDDNISIVIITKFE